MAVSLNLYCNEAPNEIVVSCEAYDDDDDDNESDHCSVDYDDDLLINLFETEVYQMLESKVVSSRFHHNIVTARKDAIQWMLKVHCFYRFRPETAYLSISYMDRFLSARPLPQGKGWPMQLLSVSCLSLAAKMEETAVPFLLDLQIMKPRFLFKPKTVQRMEVLVMQTLNWRLRIITPFDFVYCFIARISSCFNDSHQPNRLCHLFSLASDLIIDICIAAIDSLDYPPSAIAAAVVLWITNLSVDEQNLGHLHNGVNQVINTGMVKKIYKVIEGKRSSLKLMPQSPTCVLEAALLCKEIAKYC
ncbi:hypothetical protein ES319_A02G164500v1 [Gossypium barbadense]|uniref:Cyclin-like domain-containing protein n=1 Tax=Gossypium barbadense TaxID=3634 RepID=A0A5J5WRU8_GOSBA|nr:hypothetical protein ES319_A02G164500v1 [Gossypium barbadense]